MKRNRKEKWAVYGDFGGNFTNLEEAKRCAKEASTTEEYNYKASIVLIEKEIYYIDYENGKCTRDGWTIKKPKKHNENKPVKVKSRLQDQISSYTFLD